METCLLKTTTNTIAKLLQWNQNFCLIFFKTNLFCKPDPGIFKRSRNLINCSALCNLINADDAAQKDMVHPEVEADQL
jgi:hypothetical protein